MPSERALLIKQRQQEALRRQQQEIEERDAIRKQKELGINASQPIQPITTPETIHDLFNSRYQPKAPAHPPPQTNNKSEDARLRAYEQKRARFLAKKRAQMNQSQQPIQPQTTYNITPNHYLPSQVQLSSIQHSIEPNAIHQPSQPIHNIAPNPSPPHHIPYNASPPQHIPHSMHHDLALRPEKAYNIPHNPPYPPHDLHRIERQHDLALRPEKEYEPHLQQPFNPSPPQDLYRMGDRQEHGSYPVQNNTTPRMEQHTEYNPYNEHEAKKTKQEIYRDELLQQMKEKQMQKQDNHQTNPVQNEYFPSSLSLDKRTKQEKYRNELLEQMKMKEKSLYEAHNHTNAYFGSSVSPYKDAHESKKQKREKQEKYRQELMAQMRQKQHNNHDMNPALSHKITEAKETEEHGPNKYDYAKQLEEQMKLKQLTKIAQKERQLLEDKQMLMGGGFLNGFGNNEPAQHGHQHRQSKKMDSKMLYKMELDKQCKELQAKKRREKQMKEQEEVRLDAKVRRDRDQLIQEKYKEDMEEEMNAPHKSWMEYKEKADRDPDVSMGIFGRDAERDKMEKARKQELYQHELKRQAEEHKRKKREKEQMELEKEWKLEMKIQRELKELEQRYQREKSQDVNIGVAVKGSPAKIRNVSQLFAPNIPSPDIANIPSHSELFASNIPAPNRSQIPNITHSNAVSTMNSVLIPPPEVRHPNRPSTSKRMLNELLNLKQDLLENQKMIREELQMHKQQIKQQLATVSTQNEKEILEETNTKSFQKELSEYHHKISTEIESLRSAILEQQKRTPKQQKPKKVSVISEPISIPKEQRLSFNIDTNVNSQFIPCTPLLPQTAGSAFTTTSTYNGNDNSTSLSRLNSGFTDFGVDEYLLSECKKNNEYLRSVSTTRAHTPNIYRMDSFTDKDMNTPNICEKSIKSKSDFLYNMVIKKDDTEEDDDDEMEVNKQASLTDIAEVIDDGSNDKDDTVHTLLHKNKNRLHYFRSTTPLDSTRSLKIGLQKIEDLLSETEKLNRNNMNHNKTHELSMNFDDSLYELM